MKLLDKILKPKTVIKIPVVGVANGGEEARMRKIIERDPIGYIKRYKHRVIKSEVTEKELAEFNYNFRDFYKAKCAELTFKDLEDLTRIARSFNCNMEIVRFRVNNYIERCVHNERYECINGN